jgi:hypothetical protein
MIRLTLVAVAVIVMLLAAMVAGAFLGEQSGAVSEPSPAPTRMHYLVLRVRIPVSTLKPFRTPAIFP